MKVKIEAKLKFGYSVHTIQTFENLEEATKLLSKLLTVEVITLRKPKECHCFFSRDVEYITWSEVEK